MEGVSTQMASPAILTTTTTTIVSPAEKEEEEKTTTSGCGKRRRATGPLPPDHSLVVHLGLPWSAVSWPPVACC